MKVQIVAGVLAVLLVSGCESRYSPNNWGWFSGGSGEATLAPRRGYEDTSDRRPLVDQVTSIKVDDVPGGVIVTAVGLPSRQGYWAVELLPTYKSVAGKPSSKDGVMRLEFKTIPPLKPYPSGSPASRELVASCFISDQTLRPVKTITVVGARNSQSARP